MYIKWRKEQLRDKARSTVLRFQIVRSYRDKVTNQVRSEFVAYLASIHEAHCDTPLMQERFWREVDRKLARLSLATDDEQHIREKLLERVPRPRSMSDIVASLLKSYRWRAQASLK
jgi:hypothetical protein